MDEKIDAGEFIVFRDGDYIRVARGINSLTTVSDTKTDDFKKIKMIDVMDHGFRPILQIRSKTTG